MELTRLDRFTRTFAPQWTERRLLARLRIDRLVRHYEAAQGGRRTSGWARTRGDVNALLSLAIPELRMHARDLRRNNGWAKRAVNIIANNTVGWGLVPKATTKDATLSTITSDLWKRWGDSTQCDADGRLNIYGLQRLALTHIAVDGEAMIRRRWRRPSDGLVLPLQLQVVEADHLDITKDEATSESGGKIIQGVEFDAIGRRAAYWLHSDHPGSRRGSAPSKRVPASEIIHVFDLERAGQCRGVSWLGASIVTMKDLDEFEDAELVKQKIAQFFAAFVTDMEGVGAPVGAVDSTKPGIETFEPGTVSHLPAGKDVKFSSPPNTTNPDFRISNLLKLAAGMGVTYEELTGDYRNANFSSARQARIAHYENVRHWRWNMLVPQLCDPVWAWAMEAAALAGEISGELPTAGWTAPPMPMIEPDKEGLAIQRMVRTGAKTFSEMVREQGGDPEAHWAEYEADLKRLDAGKIKLDSDVRAVSQAGLTQERVGSAGGQSAPPSSEDRAAPDESEDVDVSDFEERGVLEIERMAGVKP